MVKYYFLGTPCTFLAVKLKKISVSQNNLHQSWKWWQKFLISPMAPLSYKEMDHNFQNYWIIIFMSTFQYSPCHVLLENRFLAFFALMYAQNGELIIIQCPKITGWLIFMSSLRCHPKWDWNITGTPINSSSIILKTGKNPKNPL